MLMAAFALPKPTLRLGSANRYKRKVKFAIASGLPIPASVACPISQAAIVATAHNIVLGPGVARVRWPYLEDLINSSVRAFPAWLHENSGCAEGTLRPPASMAPPCRSNSR